MKSTSGVKGGYEFKISSIAPNSMILIKNDYSIGLLLNLGEFNFLFSGDIENKTIDRIEEFYLLEFIDYIKVPHHSSYS